MVWERSSEKYEPRADSNNIEAHLLNVFIAYIFKEIESAMADIYGGIISILSGARSIMAGFWRLAVLLGRIILEILKQIAKRPGCLILVFFLYGSALETPF